MLEDKELMVYWYDLYDDEHSSKVYYIDANRDRFLIVDDNGNFRWIDTDACYLSYWRSKGEK